MLLMSFKSPTISFWIADIYNWVFIRWCTFISRSIRRFSILDVQILIETFSGGEAVGGVSNIALNSSSLLILCSLSTSCSYSSTSCFSSTCAFLLSLRIQTPSSFNTYFILMRDLCSIIYLHELRIQIFIHTC